MTLRFVGTTLSSKGRTLSARCEVRCAPSEPRLGLAQLQVETVADNYRCGLPTAVQQQVYDKRTGALLISATHVIAPVHGLPVGRVPDRAKL